MATAFLIWRISSFASFADTSSDIDEFEATAFLTVRFSLSESLANTSSGVSESDALRTSPAFSIFLF